jgi:hypothetical protein
MRAFTCDKGLRIKVRPNASLIFHHDVTFTTSHSPPLIAISVFYPSITSSESEHGVNNKDDLCVINI